MKDEDPKLEEIESSGCRCYEYFFPVYCNGYNVSYGEYTNMDVGVMRD